MESHGWTRQKVVGSIGILGLFALFIFTSLNIGTGANQEVKGVVTSVGIDSSSKFELPPLLITIKLADNSIVIIEVPKGSTYTTGDIVTVIQSERLISPGYEYKLKGAI